MNSKILSINNFFLKYKHGHDYIKVLDSINLELYQNDVLSILGESGSGKTSLAKSILNLHNKSVKYSGEIIYNNQNILELSYDELEAIRGKKISYIFQDPHTTLNPLLTIGYQINETLKTHLNISSSEAKKEGLDILHQVQLKDVDDVYKMYPHQLSGGMKQRILIALAICCSPEIVIADEPTTALDNNVQNVIVKLILDLCKKNKISLIWITHNFNLAKHISNKIIIMYGGKIIEVGNKNFILNNPLHPYTKELINISDYSKYVNKNELNYIKGDQFSFLDKETNCRFVNRCPINTPACSINPINFTGDSKHSVLCIHGK